MSHSKEKRQSLEERFPELRQYLVGCVACGRKGRDPNVDWDAFPPHTFGPWIRAEMLRDYDLLRLNASGLCADCAAAAGRHS